MISSTDRQLGVLLRQTQWLLDDAAHDIPAGRFQATQRDELAVVLEHVAGLIRATTNVVVPPQQQRSRPASLPARRIRTE